MKPRGEIKELAKERIRAQRAPAILIGFVFSLMGFASSLIDQMFLQMAPMIGRIPYYIIFWAGMLVLWIMMVNMYGLFVDIYEGEKTSVGELFTGLGTRFFRKLGGYLWMTLWIAIWSLPSGIVIGVLGALGGGITVTRSAWGGHIGFELSGWYAFVAMLCFIPVIIKALSYYAAPYILGSHTEVKAIHALQLSKRITEGHRGKIFVMYLSFIGWTLLGLLPVFVGIPFLIAPRMVGLGLLLLFLGFLGTAALFIVLISPYMNTSFAGLFVELRDHALANGVVTREELAMEEPPTVYYPSAAPPMYPAAPIAPPVVPPVAVPVEPAAPVPAESEVGLEEEIDDFPEGEDEDEGEEYYDEEEYEDEEDDLTDE